MKIRKSMIFLSIVLLVLIFSIVWVFLKFSEPIEKVKRPNAVPVGAVWEGGPDGGNWIYCTKVSNNKFYCEVYEDFNGEVLYKGEFILEGKETSLSELKSILGVYSGDYIYLKDGRTMTTVVPHNSVKVDY